MFRGWVCALGLALPLAVVGCTQNGTLNVTWDFLGTEPASSGCGQHGVDAILLSGTDNNGDGVSQTFLCPPGQASVSVKPGTWTVKLAMRRFDEMDIPPPGGTIPIGVAAVTASTPGSIRIHLNPVPACSDMVDNNHNGRVDLADPGCHGQAGGASESDSGLPDSGPGDSGQGDSGQVDSGLPDSGQVDSGPPDSGQRDAAAD
jgi:hypothetical protein